MVCIGCSGAEHEQVSKGAPAKVLNLLEKRADSPWPVVDSPFKSGYKWVKAEMEIENLVDY